MEKLSMLIKNIEKVVKDIDMYEYCKNEDFKKIEEELEEEFQSYNPGEMDRYSQGGHDSYIYDYGVLLADWLIYKFIHNKNDESLNKYILKFHNLQYEYIMQYLKIIVKQISSKYEEEDINKILKYSDEILKENGYKQISKKEYNCIFNIIDDQ